MSRKFRRNTFTKDPDDILDYTINWHRWLEELRDKIVASEWFVESGITINGHVFDDEKATVWLSGGTNGKNYKITNRITTNGGRRVDRSFIIRVRENG